MNDTNRIIEKVEQGILEVAKKEEERLDARLKALEELGNEFIPS